MLSVLRVYRPTQQMRLRCISKGLIDVPRALDTSVNYEAPPVVEVAMSVQFDPAPRFTIAHLGVFWFSLKEKFPNLKTAQPIVATNEDFGGSGQWIPPSLQLALTNEPQCRLQMSSSDDQWMCQIQFDRIVVNWRKRQQEYPRFGATLNRFLELWGSLQKFFVDYKQEEVTPTYWELTYVNRIPSGSLWSTPADWPLVFPGLWGERFGCPNGLNLRGLRGQWVWDVDHEAARLYVDPSPARPDKGEDLLMLNLTARGIAAERENVKEAADHIEAITDKMHLGHNLIVLMFDAISSPKAKQHWKRK